MSNQSISPIKCGGTSATIVATYRLHFAFSYFSPWTSQRNYQNINDIEATLHTRFSLMGSPRSRRGRPKGTGIDDTGRLREIAAMIADDPELRPTTAIKNIGISDPSVIRRLRDKFNEAREMLMQETEKAEFRGNAFHAEPQPTTDTRTMALNHAREPSKTAAPKSRSTQKIDNDKDEEPRQPEISPVPQKEIVQRLVSSGLSTASSIMNMHLAIATQTFHTPAVRSAMRYQIAFSQALFGFAGPQPKANC